MTGRSWKLGDRVYHAGRPEWGAGEVRSAEGVTEGGRASQRLTIRFERAGVKTLSTTFADLRPAEEMPDIDRLPDEPENEPAENATAAEIAERFTRLPEPATDPFRSRRARLEHTLSLFRFTAAGASLLDWAASQSGLRDPLTRFSRHELEQYFERFKQSLDAHARRLVSELKREDPEGLAQLGAAAPAGAQQALKRLTALR